MITALLILAAVPVYAFVGSLVFGYKRKHAPSSDEFDDIGFSVMWPLTMAVTVLIFLPIVAAARLPGWIARRRAELPKATAREVRRG